MGMLKEPTLPFRTFFLCCMIVKQNKEKRGGLALKKLIFYFYRFSILTKLKIKIGFDSNLF
jgi:hypothetical protein